MKRLFILLFPLLFFSCQEQQQEVFEKPYFDVKGFIEGEIERLQKEQPTIEKVITTDGVTEKQVITDIDWEDELSSFLELDINKPSWRNSYTADTSKTDNTFKITYTTELEDHPVYMLEVTLDRKTGECIGIWGGHSAENFVYESTQSLNYTKGEEYSITGMLSFEFIFNTSYQVYVGFLGQDSGPQE